MRNLAIGLVLAAFPLAAILSAMRLRSRFAISWVHAGVFAMLSVPAALIGRWLVAASLFGVLVSLSWASWCFSIDATCLARTVLLRVSPMAERSSCR